MKEKETEQMKEAILQAPYIWLRRPGPGGTLLGSEPVQKITGGSIEEFDSAAAAAGPPLIAQIHHENGSKGKCFLIKVPALEEYIPRAPLLSYAPAVPPPAPPPMANPAGVELMMLKFEMERLKEDKSRAVDTHWLQAENSRLNTEISKIQNNFLEREREAYQKGKDDAEEAPGITEGLGIKDLGPIMEMIGKNRPPPPAQEPPPTTGAPQNDLKSLILMFLDGTIAPEKAASIITRIYGEPALVEIALNKEKILKDAALDPEIAIMIEKNAAVGEIMAKLNEELEKWTH